MSIEKKEFQEQEPLGAVRPDPLSQYLKTGDKPAFYANGFQAGLTHSDCYLIFNQNKADKVAITLPLSTIKSLKTILSQMENDYEKQFGIKILSSEELVSRKSKQKDNK
ncbi:hypothetical protein [Daejeonella sp.]|uniref:hypothetical protein n=1 Tax=Daejeonella sp. TaxID=2805397 RepID=UPI0030BB345C